MKFVSIVGTHPLPRRREKVLLHAECLFKDVTNIPKRYPAKSAHTTLSVLTNNYMDILSSKLFIRMVSH